MSTGGESTNAKELKIQRHKCELPIDDRLSHKGYNIVVFGLPAEPYEILDVYQTQLELAYNDND